MAFQNLDIFTCVALLMSFVIVDGGLFRTQKMDNSASCDKSITVDPSGKGRFSTVQSAINSVPSSNKHWVCVHIKAGVYREKVKVPNDKPYIMLKGEGMTNTKIVWNDHHNYSRSATFSVFADYFVAEGISFTNSYNHKELAVGKENAVAAAVAVEGDKISFHGCGFYGYQDTLCDNQHRHYFKDCTIEGGVDFICGDGQSIYENCTLSVIGGGFITAQSRARPVDTSGFIFKNGMIVGKSRTRFGRAWGNSSRVLFHRTYFPDIIVPDGWSIWDKAGHEKDIVFAEDRCRGPGSDTSKRVPWLKKLDKSTVKKLIDISYIDAEGWIEKQKSLL